jgi:hypothetical protein
MTTAAQRREPEARPRATYQDVLDAPNHQVAEIVDGVLYATVKRHSKLTPWRHRKLTPEETAYVDGSAGSEGLSADGGFRAGRWCW